MSTTTLDVILAGCPGADQQTADYILWERTPFPCGRITARSLYKAASRFRRADDHGIRLCDWCDNRSGADASLCTRCARTMDACRRGE